MASSELVVFLKGQIGDFHSKLQAAEKDVASVGKKGGDGFAKLASVGKAALFGIGASAIGIGTVAVAAALKGEAAHARLVNAIASTGGAYKTYGTQVDDASAKLAKYGFENDDVEDSIGRIARATKNTKLAISEQGLAADIARGRNISLADATSILVKVQTGHVALLGRLGINTKDATGKTISQREALQRLAQMYGGAASENAKTFAGKLQAVEAQAKNLAEKLGEKLIPVLSSLISIVLSVVDWLEKHRKVAVALGIVVGGALLVAIAAYTASMIAAAAATIAATWPILAVVAAIGLLVAAVILIWNNWDTIWNFIANHKALALVVVVLFPIVGALLAIVGAAKFLADNWATIWPAVVTAVQSAYAAVKPIIDAIVTVIKGAFTVIDGVVKFWIAVFKGDWSGAWAAARQVLQGAWDVIRGIVSGAVAAIGLTLKLAWIAIGAGVRSGWAAVIDFFKSLPGRIRDTFAGLVGDMFNLGVRIIHAIADGISNAAGTVGGAIKGVIDHIPGASIITSHIPGFASGGLVPGPIGAPMLAVVHGGEFVVPNSGIAKPVASSIGGGVTLAPTIVVNNHDDGPLILRKLASALKNGQGNVEFVRALHAAGV